MKKYFFIIAALAVCAACNDNATTPKGPEKPSDAVAAAKGNLVINEVSGNSKFVELYNISDKAVNLEGVTFIKNEEEGALWTGVADQVLAAKSYLILYSNKTSLENPDANYTFAGGLSAKKNVKIEIFDASGTSIDAFVRCATVEWDATLPEDTEYDFSRVPDGTGEWVYAAETPGAANGEKVKDIDNSVN
ncbi:MAG: lamin tail domain-containing protein [Bacteroidales bacterium]|nr:lamin tail domain-containing protein [Candidatus Cryptobacteroides aphodequi]